MSSAENVNSESKLDIANQKTVMFYDDELLAVHTSDSHVYRVCLRNVRGTPRLLTIPICGIATKSVYKIRAIMGGLEPY